MQTVPFGTGKPGPVPATWRYNDKNDGGVDFFGGHLAAAAGSAAKVPLSYAGRLASEAEFGPLHKTGKSGRSRNSIGTQLFLEKDVGTISPFQAEGMGFEPTTPFGAPDFESGRWPIRLPSNGLYEFNARSAGWQERQA